MAGIRGWHLGVAVPRTYLIPVERGDAMTIPTLDALLLTSLFGLGAAIHLAGPAFLRARYRRWRFPANTYLVVGVLQLLAAVFLANPITRIWGVALAALITFVTIVNLLNHGKYAYSVPALLVLAALVPATLAGPL